MRAAPGPLAQQRNLILALLLGLAAGAWVLVIWQAARSGGVAGLTMGLGAPLFLAIWVAMMVAMMFPTAAPMILMFARVHAGKRDRGQPFVSTWIFVAAYLVIWSLFGALAYLLAVGAERLAGQSLWLMDHAARLGGGLIILAGLYQLSPLKRICLARCRTPLGFILGSWRDGYAGSFRMGIEHGLSCLGCCWLLFVMLFPLGVMNVAVMALLTVLIFAEKSWSAGEWIARFAAVGFIAYGLLVIALPRALPAAM